MGNILQSSRVSLNISDVTPAIGQATLLAMVHLRAAIWAVGGGVLIGVAALIFGDSLSGNGGWSYAGVNEAAWISLATFLLGLIFVANGAVIADNATVSSQRLVDDAGDLSP